MVLGWLGWRQGRDLSRAEHAGRRSWQMLETVPEALLVLDAKTGRVLSANNRCRTVFGREPESLKSLPLDALLPSLELPAGTDETPAPHAVELRETEALQADGTHLPVDIGVSQFVAAPTDALRTIISIRDARPRLAAESGRLDAERRTRQIIQSVPGVVYRCAMDEQWTMAFVSDQVEVLTGYPADDFIGNRRTSFRGSFGQEQQPDPKEECHQHHAAKPPCLPGPIADPRNDNHSNPPSNANTSIQRPWQPNNSANDQNKSQQCRRNTRQPQLKPNLHKNIMGMKRKILS